MKINDKDIKTNVNSFLFILIDLGPYAFLGLIFLLMYKGLLQ